MNKQNHGFYYEHIGHMQFSVLTLRTFQALQELSGNSTGVYIQWERLRQSIEQNGFSRRQADGELERFCYGYECSDRRGNDGIREIALTEIGIAFLRGLLNESLYQPCQIALLVRPAKRKNGFFNVTIQETTFFSPAIYQTISDFGFRAGGAREFSKCIEGNKLLNLLEVVGPQLSISPSDECCSLERTIQMVQTSGKYWASVGGRYSWFVFPQMFSLPFDSDDWNLYDLLVGKLVRPPEWGGGRAVSYAELTRELSSTDKVDCFRHNGIIRPLWKHEDLDQANFCLTAPGYLMWERKKKGFLAELRVRRLHNGFFELAVCDAWDLPQGVASELCSFNKNCDTPAFRITGTLHDVKEAISLIQRLAHSHFREFPL